MARPLRIELASGLYHVTSRGNRREDIYLDDDDRRLWLTVFAEVCDRYHWHCHGWCQMTNHYHIIVETIDANLSQGMRHLNGVYTQRHNRRHKRVGHVYQGRYKGILVEREAYLLELSRYVVLNPVRAAMVNDPQDWPWSSYHATIGVPCAPFEWLTTDWILKQFSADRTTATLRYIDFVREGIGLPSIWSELKDELYLGSNHFVQKMAEHIEDSIPLKEIPRAQRRSLAKPLEFYENTEDNRTNAMACAYLSGQYTMKEIALHFNVHYSSVSRAVRQHREMRECKT